LVIGPNRGEPYIGSGHSHHHTPVRHQSDPFFLAAHQSGMVETHAAADVVVDATIVVVDTIDTTVVDRAV
jgi:hypothetical protein